VAARRGVPFLNEINGPDCPNRLNRPIEIVGGNPCLSNGVSTPANENTGTLAGVSGADVHSIGFVSIEYRKRAEAATSLCLSIANCDPQDACQIMEAALVDLGAGAPVPPLFGIMEAATDWAEWANTAELKAYALTCYNRLSATDQKAFLAYVGRVS
jgi:hypothetical protein